jgi:RNA 2',3'-cyclic 3'-phosphodiesterase
VRLFVAVVPPDDVLDRLASLRRPARPGVRWTRREQWHVTLRFLGEVDEAAVPAVVAALDAAPLDAAPPAAAPPAAAPPAAAVLGPRVAALGRRVVQIPVAGLDDLAAAVTAATATVGRPPEPRPFQGHVTLARVARGGLRDLVGEPVAATFPVVDVRLVHSRPGGRGGPVYADVHVRPLG